MEEVSDDLLEKNATEDTNPPEVSAKELRANERFRVNLNVLIRLSDGDVAHAQAVDLSLGGIYIEYASAADVGKVFEMAFDLPFTNDFKRIIVKARVMRVIVIGSRNLYGLAFIFTEFAKESDKILEKYIELRKLKLS